MLGKEQLSPLADIKLTEKDCEQRWREKDYRYNRSIITIFTPTYIEWKSTEQKM